MPVALGCLGHWREGPSLACEKRGTLAYPLVALFSYILIMTMNETVFSHFSYVDMMDYGNYEHYDSQMIRNVPIPNCEIAVVSGERAGQVIETTKLSVKVWDPT